MAFLHAPSDATFHSGYLANPVSVSWLLQQHYTKLVSWRMLAAIVSRTSKANAWVLR